MSITARDPGLLESPSGLDFSRTVDRTLVHRRNLTEVFLTDVQRTDGESFAAAALLPVVHPHYTSHTGTANRTLDPMLLIECCRQAETYAAHALFDVEMGASFVLRSWSAELFPDALGQPTYDGTTGGAAPGPVPTGPRELLLSAVTRNARRVGGRIRGLDYDFQLWIAGNRVGRVRMEVGYVASVAYVVIRGRGRDGPPPWSDGLLPVRTGRPVVPAAVGRVNATDTLLLDVVARPDRVAATLRVPVENVSLFDHPQDHVPGMVLLEAARQIAALAARQWDGAAVHTLTMVAMESSFAAYAELDEAVTVTATRAEGTQPGPVDAGPPWRRPVEVVFQQATGEISRVSVVMELASGTPSARAERGG
ncbi:hypothetical protein OG792_09820 [Micromonospora sp. NBC_01699]|uniref:AfsA-related hotdog domain-containing protein n=1 Tax=Micromonospora sp. NBC_01699 TaxID=2975984 RepID=UPI002E2FB36B|nr:AfsA-related hotdog domain-containing protein [Micromonospora sp. NBC_01699]